jgi:hypothetical protein
VSHITYCTGCGNGMVTILTEKGSAEPSCFWCEGVDARTLEMAKWADSPTGRPDRAAAQSFD